MVVVILIELRKMVGENNGERIAMIPMVRKMMSLDRRM